MRYKRPYGLCHKVLRFIKTVLINVMANQLQFVAMI